jgi:ribosomal-protein-alanine acetyltransferase
MFGDRVRSSPKSVHSSAFSFRQDLEFMEPFIRPAVPSDLPAIVALEKSSDRAAHWSAEQYEKLFAATSPRRIVLVLEEEQPNQSALQGFIVVRVVGAEWEIENIAVASSARRRGLGARLLSELLKLARSGGAEVVFLEVRESNLAARALYERSLFKTQGHRGGYYKDPQEDAIIYRLELSSESL